ncbi:SsrA-binding protein SmpB [Elusimicrobiota bacterium]
MKQNRKIITTNRKAFYRYYIEDTIEAGIVLTGSEAKSAKTGNLVLSDAYAIIKRGECFLLNCHISPYIHDSLSSKTYEPTRTRKLLLKRQEIGKLAGKIASRGYTLVPTEVYVNEKSLIKVSIGLAKGKKGPDKRESIKKRELDRELHRSVKLR